MGLLHLKNLGEESNQSEHRPENTENQSHDRWRLNLDNGPAACANLRDSRGIQDIRLTRAYNNIIDCNRDRYTHGGKRQDGYL